MCGSTSAVGLADADRALWPMLRERLRVPGQLMGLMRGVLGGDAEVAALVTTTPSGIARPVAVLVTPEIAEEITLLEDPRPVAIFVTDWMREHLYLYSRELWHRRR